MAHRTDWDGQSFIVLHNLDELPVTTVVELDDEDEGESLVDLLGPHAVEVGDDGRVAVELGRYGFRWLRLRRRWQSLVL